MFAFRVQLPAELIRIELILILSVTFILMLLQVAVRIARSLLSSVRVHVPWVRPVTIRIPIRVTPIVSIDICSIPAKVWINKNLGLRDAEPGHDKGDSKKSNLFHNSP
jgi:hypothetical protein